MKDLSDNQFDAFLKQKAESFDHDFDEAAWDKMERKLRKRDRVIFIRKSSFVLALLILFGGAYLLLNKVPAADTSGKTAKDTRDLKPNPVASEPRENKDNTRGTSENTDLTPKLTSLKPKAGTSSQPTQKVRGRLPTVTSNLTEVKTINTPVRESTAAVVVASQVKAQQQIPLVKDSVSSVQPANQDLPMLAASDSVAIKKSKKTAKRKQISFSVTAQSGPEVSSIKSFAGAKGSINLGILLNASLSKITISTGFRYGLKNYAASVYSYQLQNPSIASQIEGIDAACNILEIPLQASYTLFNAGTKQIRVSSGLSSYLMLKEEYNFRCIPYSGYSDYLLVKENENQHYFSVLALAASYQINPKGSNIKWALEPYFKLPLGGVGEGNVRLKSSGISLNLTYDINKQSK